MGLAAFALLDRGDGKAPKEDAKDDPKGVAPSRSRPPASIPTRPRLRRLGVLKGHAGGVSGLWFSPDGRTLVSSEFGVGNLQLWDVSSLKPLGAPLISPYVIFLSAAVSPDGGTLVTGGGDRAAFWSIPPRRPSGTPLTLSYSHDMFNVVALSPDGKTLATGGAGERDITEGVADGQVRLWDMASRRQVGGALTDHEGVATGLRFSPDGRTLAVSSEVREGAVRLWDVASRRPLGRALSHEGGITDMTFSPDGRTLATASGGVSEYGVPGVVRFWDAAAGAERGKPVPHDNWGVTALTYSGDGRTVVTVGAYDTPRMRFLDAATHRQRAKPLDPPWPNAVVAFAPDGVSLAAEEADGSISLWRIE
ncbi:WD40 repeat domain-containing protein [Streptomyces sp. NPDC002787]